METKAPVQPSIVKVAFPASQVELSYYNDLFSLDVGDIVYVDGKYAGTAGRVTHVTTHFKVNAAVYKRVLRCLNLELHGDFVRLGSFMCTSGPAVPDPECFESWVIPPSEAEAEYFLGEGDQVDLDAFPGELHIPEKIIERGMNYLFEGHVGYISVRNGEGRAFIQGTRWYALDFRLNEKHIEDLHCECVYPEFCKHETALTLALMALLAQMEPGEEAPPLRPDFFTAIDRALFFRLAAYRSAHITL